MRCFLTLRPGNRLVAAEPLLLVHIGLDQARINRERFATNKPSRDACRLTEVEWRILQVLSRLNGNLESEAAGARRRTIATSSTASYGGFAPARRAGKVREMELNLPALPALERLRCVGEDGRRARRDEGRERALRHPQHYGSPPRLGHRPT